MKIEIKKSTPYQSEYTITREDNSMALISLETKIYLVHDICHYVVEKNLEYKKGFWGMLAQGYSFNELVGKKNSQTTELRFIEQIVGPIQSFYLGYILKQNFNLFVEHLNFTLPENILDTCIVEIKSIMECWQKLSIKQQLTLEWSVLNKIAG